MMDRSTGLGGTDAMRIMKGEWNALWKEKMGQAEPVDLSNIFRVQLGIFTERFHLEWIARQKEWSIEIAPALRKRTLDGVPMFANLDGWIKDKETFIDAKHSSSDAIFHDKAQYYVAQIAHYCLVCDTSYGYLSVIPGNGDPMCGEVAPSGKYFQQLQENEAAFWWHVEKNKEPQDLGQAKKEVIREAVLETMVEGLRDYDMSSNNQWAERAGKVIELKPARDTYEKVLSEIKADIPSDAREIKGHGLGFKRDKAGRLRMTIEEGK